MDEKILEFPDLIAKQEADEKEQKKKEAIATLPHYRGEVPSKNTIRNLPNVLPGEIFWVSMDHKPYVVADRDGKKITLKALDETASVSTGLTIFDMNKRLVAKEPVMDLNAPGVHGELTAKIIDWLADNTDTKVFLMYGRDLHYVSLFVKDGEIANAETIIEMASEVGELISMDFDTGVAGEHCIEIWVRTADSDAELMYFFPYDNGVVHF